MKTSCLIIDDEPLAVQLLQRHVQESGTLVVSGICGSAVEAAVLLRSHPVELVFLDIQMPKLTGLEWVRSLKDPPAVILTTAHREYALEGYALDVVDYLLKPITFDRFMASIEKFYRRHPPRFPIQQEGVTAVDKMILLKSGTKTYQLSETEIIYIESLRDFVQFYLDNGKKLLIKYQIGQLETKLSDSFFRVHKSFIVNKRKITSFTGTGVEMGPFSIPVGNNYKHVLDKIFGS